MSAAADAKTPATVWIVSQNNAYGVSNPKGAFRDHHAACVFAALQWLMFPMTRDDRVKALTERLVNMKTYLKDVTYDEKELAKVSTNEQIHAFLKTLDNDTLTEFANGGEWFMPGKSMQTDKDRAWRATTSSVPLV